MPPDARAVLRLALLVAASLAVVAVNLAGPLAAAGGLRALLPPALDDAPAILVHYSLLPRAVVALLAGAGLGLSGLLMQQVLRNPLASPSTVGVEAGAQLALALAMVFAPVLLGVNRDAVALAGGGIAMLLVFAAARRQAFAPLAVMLAGLLVSLAATTLVTLLALMRERYLAGLFIWGGGALVQQDWRMTLDLLPRLLLPFLAALLLARPLDLLELGGGARSLGLRPGLTRALGLALAVTLAACVTSAVGIIGFLSLAAPAIVRMLGIRRFRARLLAAPLAGAALLLLTDQFLQIVETRTGIALPAGAVTAVIGAPLLLAVTLRLPVRIAPPRPAPAPAVAARPAPSRRRLLFALLGLLLVAALALLVGRAPDGAFELTRGADLALALPFRLPRLVAAGCGGLMMGAAGAALQRLTANPMASPEVLGLSSGAAAGLFVALFVVGTPSPALAMICAALGAAGVFLALVTLTAGRDSGDHLLYVGVSLGALTTALLAVVIATGDPRAAQLLVWLSGSTSLADAGTAARAAAFAVMTLLLLPLFARPLDLLALGPVAARARGLAVGPARLAILATVALATAAATLLTGPLGFIGLMAPHFARRMGFSRALPACLAAAALGALLMLVADSLARLLWFPSNLPTGLVATLIGAPLIAWLLRPSGAEP